MNDLYEYPFNDYRNYLQHHGVPGQKWYKRRAEWYPIAAWEAAQKRAGAAISKIRDRIAQGKEAKRKKRIAEERVARLAKARAAKAEKKRVEAEEKARTDEENRNRAAAEDEKNRVLKMGTVNEILKYSGQVDNATLATALQNRLNYEQKLDTIKKNKISKFEAAIDKAYKIGMLATKVSDTASNVRNSYKNIKGVLEDVGLLEKKYGKSYKNVYEIKDDIYNNILSGKIKKSDYAAYSKAVEGLDKIMSSYEKSEKELNKTYQELVGIKPASRSSSTNDAKRAAESLSKKEEENEKKKEKKKREEELKDYDKWRHYV